MPDYQLPLSQQKFEEFAIAFVFAVTEESHSRSDIISKKGETGLFAALKQTFPEATVPLFK